MNHPLFALPSYHIINALSAHVDLLKAGGFLDGLYLLRTRPNGELVLSVNHRNRPSHHRIHVGEDGLYRLNDRVYGEHRSLDALLAWLHQPHTMWPATLVRGIPRQGLSDDDVAGLCDGFVRNQSIQARTNSQR